MTACRSHAALLVLAGALALQGQEPLSDVPRESPLASLDRIDPTRSRTEAQADRVAFTVDFLQARLARGKGDLGLALRHYQRAWRHRPEQVSLLREIVALAFELKRNEQAARYAVIVAERDPQDALLLRRLATYLTEQRDWPRAARLYELAQQLDDKNRKLGDKPDLGAVTVRLEMGRLYFLTSEFEKSAAAFALVRDALADPQSGLSAESQKLLVGEGAETYSLWAEAFLAAGRLDEAEALFQKSHEAKADAPMLAFHLARVQAKRGDVKAAQERLDEYFAAKSSAAGVEPYDLLAELHVKQAPDAAAVAKMTTQRLEQLAASDGGNLALTRALAARHFAAGEFDKAEPLLAAANASQPSGDTYRKLAQIYRRRSQPEKLLAIAAESAAKTGSLEVLGEAGEAVAADKPLRDKLLELARAKLKDDAQPPVAGELFAAGLIALEAKEFDAADELLAAAAAHQPPPKESVLLRWGLGMMLANQPARAAKVFERIIAEQAVAGDESSPHYYLAAALELSGGTDEALAAARKAAELKPDDARLAAREAWILYHAERNDAARQAYLDLLARFDGRHDSAATREAVREARLALSNVELARGDYPAAVEWLQQVLDEFPEDIGAGNDLGYLWADRGEHLQRALALIERAVLAEPENAAYRDSLGWVYYRLGRYDDAVSELSKAAAGEDPDGVILDHLGDALLRAGRPAEARAAWQKAEAAFQKAEEAKKLEAVRKKLAALAPDTP